MRISDWSSDVCSSDLGSYTICRSHGDRCGDRSMPCHGLSRIDLMSADPPQRTIIAVKMDIVVIGAGQAGLSSAYHLRRIGLEPDRNFVTFDRSPGPGGAWQSRWPSLTLATANRIHDLPGLKLEDVVDADAAGEVQASVAVPRYYEAYEATFDLRVHRPVEVTVVRSEERRVGEEGVSTCRSRW